MEIRVMCVIKALQEAFSDEVMIAMYSPMSPPWRIYTGV